LFLISLARPASGCFAGEWWSATGAEYADLVKSGDGGDGRAAMVRAGGGACAGTYGIGLIEGSGLGEALGDIAAGGATVRYMLWLFQFQFFFGVLGT